MIQELELMAWLGGFFVGLAGGMLIGYIVSIFVDENEE